MRLTAGFGAIVSTVWTTHRRLAYLPAHRARSRHHVAGGVDAPIAPGSRRFNLMTVLTNDLTLNRIVLRPFLGRSVIVLVKVRDLRGRVEQPGIVAQNLRLYNRYGATWTPIMRATGRACVNLRAR